MHLAVLVVLDKDLKTEVTMNISNISTITLFKGFTIIKMNNHDLITTEEEYSDVMDKIDAAISVNN